MLDSTPSWVAVMTYPNAEPLVAQRFEEGEPPIEHYLPKIIAPDKRFKDKPHHEKAMFPCYLFARINNKQIYQTRTTRGVLRIVSTQHSIIQVPERDIENIRRFEASLRDIHVHETVKLVRGARTVITDGEFAGMEGTIVKGCKDGNFCVSIDVMHISIVVRLSRKELQPIKEPEPEETKNNL